MATHLQPDSGEATGLKWAAPAAGGDFIEYYLTYKNGGMVMIKKRTIGKGSPVVGYGVPRFSLFEGDFPIVSAPDSALAKPKKKKRKHGKSQSSTSELVA
jgi:hypothetical protein